jgi:cyclopropane fatty-acyl-phospholipid synthase-like methyltransferase
MIDSPTKTAKTVVFCYDLLDLAATGGIEDYAEGIYERDLNKSYIDAQRAQVNYLLDEIKCYEGSHILDIGCGNGALLESARFSMSFPVIINS